VIVGKRTVIAIAMTGSAREAETEMIVLETGIAIETTVLEIGIAIGTIMLEIGIAIETTMLGIEIGIETTVLEAGIAIGMIVLETAIGTIVLGSGTTARMSGMLAARATRIPAAIEVRKALAIMIPVATETIAPHAIRIRAGTGTTAAASATTLPAGTGKLLAGVIVGTSIAWQIKAALVSTQERRAAARRTISLRMKQARVPSHSISQAPKSIITPASLRPKTQSILRHPARARVSSPGCLLQASGEPPGRSRRLTRPRVETAEPDEHLTRGEL
jgi:hypothetical protein